MIKRPATLFGALLGALSLALAAAPLPAHAAYPQDVAGRWNGSYICNNGERWLQLDIKRNAGQWVDVTFTFGLYQADNDNRDEALGSFHMAGRIDDAHLRLKGDYWYRAAPGYTTVDLDGDFTDNLHTFSGQVLFEGCDGFKVTR